MEWSMAGEIEELVVCACCKRTFDEERPPKLLACKHSFCLACVRDVLARGRDLACLHCWKRTDLPARVDTLPTHAALLALARRLSGGVCGAHALPALWCCACGVRACRACDAHAAHAHALRPPSEARALLARDCRELRADLARLAARRRDLLLRALDAATALKVRLETELAAPAAPEPGGAGASPTSAADERSRLRARLAAASAQARADELVRAARGPLERELLRRALGDPPPPDARDPLLFLANYCTAQLHARAAVDITGTDEADATSPSTSDTPGVSPCSPPPRPPSAFPLFYFNLEVNGAAFGRVVIEVRSDVAPRMARNFSVLATGELGLGYRGCTVFQCWENESVITGDFELNNGRGGRSVFEESYFMPDDTKLAAVRGAVGMRRSQKRHDNLGLVGSQFRIVLREMRGFTAIFATVVEGLELVDRLSRTGDSAGKPHSTILISSCGKLN
ncbi:uncharacterized protein LOC128673945 [Plodia interpunctella]|uniref:uncharacterized protein LOC128673945 n=1 Tax=Plodia interpunctella TaxID=58824 RepID=UPI002368AC85|nr:uncharacterized protein LOC128673945 [Plodia interpunctella]